MLMNDVCLDFSKDNTTAGIQESAHEIIMNLNKLLLIRGIGYVIARAIIRPFYVEIFYNTQTYS